MLAAVSDGGQKKLNSVKKDSFFSKHMRTERETMRLTSETRLSELQVTDHEWARPKMKTRRGTNGTDCWQKQVVIGNS